MSLTEITSEAELREALGGFPGERAATKAHYAPEHYSTLLY
jgi:hypothetical protein